jgi:hypothetical protein
MSNSVSASTRTKPKSLPKSQSSIPPIGSSTGRGGPTQTGEGALVVGVAVVGGNVGI